MHNPKIEDSKTKQNYTWLTLVMAIVIITRSEAI